MKILRLSAMALAAAAGCAIGCGTSSGCNPTNLNSNSNYPPPNTCGPGTVNVNGVCELPSAVQSR